MVRSAGAAARNLLKRYRRMKIELDVGGGSCLFERLKFMNLRARGVKGIKAGHAMIELNPDDYKRIEMEDKVNEGLFKKLEELKLEDPGCIQKSVTALSKLMVITSVPLQISGVIGGVTQRAMTYNRGEVLGKAIENLRSETFNWEKELNIAAGTAWKTLDYFTGKTSLKEKGLKVVLENEISLMKDKIDRVEKLMSAD